MRKIPKKYDLMLFRNKGLDIAVSYQGRLVNIYKVLRKLIEKVIKDIDIFWKEGK